MRKKTVDKMNVKKISGYTVNVGNIGNIDYESEEEARAAFEEYVDQSKSGYGRAAGEDVYLLQDGEIVDEYFGTFDTEASVKKQAIGTEPGTEMSDEDIAESYTGLVVEEASMQEGSDSSGSIHLEFPNETAAGDASMGGGFIIYDDGQVAFDFWLPEPQYFLLSNFIHYILKEEGRIFDMSEAEIEEKLKEKGLVASKKTGSADDWVGEKWKDAVEQVEEILFLEGATINLSDFESGRKELIDIVKSEADFSESDSKYEEEFPDGEGFGDEIYGENTYNEFYLGPNWQYGILKGKSGKYYGIATPHMGGDIRGGYGESYFFELDTKDVESVWDYFLQFFRGDILGGFPEIVIDFKDGSSISFNGVQDSDIPYYGDYYINGSDDSLAAIFGQVSGSLEGGLDRDDFVRDVKYNDEEIPSMEAIRDTYKWRDEHGQLDLFRDQNLDEVQSMLKKRLSSKLKQSKTNVKKKAASQEEIDDLRAQLEEKQKELAEVESEIDTFEPDLYDYEDLYNEMLDEEEVTVGGMSFSGSYALQQLDPTAYRVGLIDYVDSLDIDPPEEWTDRKEELEEEIDALEVDIDDLESELELENE